MIAHGRNKDDLELFEAKASESGALDLGNSAPQAGFSTTTKTAVEPL
jgi:hypothetical protein